MASAAPPVDQRELLVHSVLVGLTPLIPVPFLDDAVKLAIERRLVRRIADAHGRTLSDDDVHALTEEPSGNLLLSIGKGIVTFPLKLIFRKLFVVLEVKRASDEASKTYHRGVLLDSVLRADVLAPTGPCDPNRVRIALDAVVDDGTVSPLGRALSSAFEGSRAGLTSLGRSLLKRIRKEGAVSGASVEKAVDHAARTADGGGEEQDVLDGILGRMSAAVASVPERHFVELEERLGRELGVALRATE